MQLDVIDQPADELGEFFKRKIVEFNQQHWEVKERLPLAVTVRNEAGEIVAGASARTFGNWLLLDYLWVSPALRGQDWGSRVLQALEGRACERGCRFVLLDTLGFQARPFYERHGYRVEWEQPAYPRDGCKYFMSKTL
ncbi:GNAT family N-acetyltransferase [Crenobacter sp. SG2305]|uniref:GNAT family N-acetyltransferase n=1 Tax=Crenobacter oryzisoli TaxID=3056844 RepID=UPI0025AB4A9B|nr:GNAT family N-acetyltransferase [Crenobacter sp. SG2305]MDN0081845.1 GNAT family N-acetyltransferase [Crenobacter sp. SG2305]